MAVGAHRQELPPCEEIEEINKRIRGPVCDALPARLELSLNLPLINQACLSFFCCLLSRLL
jgi:hypothetical protein